MKKTDLTLRIVYNLKKKNRIFLWIPLEIRNDIRNQPFVRKH